MVECCGAKTRSGAPCKAKRMANGRCRMHGGKSTGAPKTPGSLYSRYLTEEEQRICAALKLGSIDDELRLTRIRLMRALALENKIDSNDPDSELQIESKAIEPQLIGGMIDTEINEQGEEVEITITRRQFRRRDYSGLIDRLTARIANLESQRSMLLNNSLDTERKQLELDRLKKDKAAGVVHNVIVVPHCTSVDDWEKAAQIQQQGLTDNDV